MNNVALQECPYCGDPLSNPRRKQCGKPDCKRAYQNERMKAYYATHGRPLEAVTCTNCGQEFTRRKYRKVATCPACSRSRQASIAGAASAARRRADAQERARQRMQLVHVPRHVWKSQAVQPLGAAQGKPRFVAGRCVVCSASFVVEWQTGAKYCSKECLRSHNRGRRRARLRGAYQEPVTWRVLYREHGPTCYLCQGTTDPTDYTISIGSDGREVFIAGPTYPSLDHVVALANGGQHHRGNARLACMLCNSIKNDTV